MENSMNINIKEIEYCKLEVNCSCDYSAFKSKREEVVQGFSSLPVPGYRKGKADELAIRTHYRKDINNSLKRVLAEQAFTDAVVDNKIKAIGTPNFTKVDLDDKNFSCQFVLFTAPEFSLGQYKGLEIPKVPAETSALDLASQTLQTLRMQHASNVPFTADDFVQSGDSVIVDYDLFVDGKKMEDFCVKGETLVAGATKFPEFDNGVLGLKIGESCQFEIVAPDAAPEALKGKKINFDLKIINGAKSVPASVDDELAKKCDFASLDELQAAINTNANAKIQEQERNKLVEAVSHKLVDAHEIKVPSFLIDAESEQLAKSFGQTSVPEEQKEMYRKAAEKNVKLSLILSKIKEEEPEAQLSEEEKINLIKNRLTNSGQQVNFQELLQKMDAAGYLSMLASRLQDEYVLDFVVKQSKIIE